MSYAERNRHGKTYIGKMSGRRCTGDIIIIIGREQGSTALNMKQ